ncbi:hypothetical protein LOC498796, isoform CRA_b [Rattus norvegicus]|uniref:Uncharacterized protein LOC498796 n=1 Tax=Rattus norvegicus TaxID=10116 RepID=A6JM09_RAT|nr:hypothetical protein LOC498796, isoform CRA_b [Rattus norvegicus]
MGSLTHYVQDGPLEDIDPKDSCLIPRNIMAEPDYIEDDNPELIRPQKLINPVKTSRNHQDLHRELLMNQKRQIGRPTCIMAERERQRQRARGTSWQWRS